MGAGVLPRPPLPATHADCYHTSILWLWCKRGRPLSDSLRQLDAEAKSDSPVSFIKGVARDPLQGATREDRTCPVPVLQVIRCVQQVVVRR